MPKKLNYYTPKEIMEILGVSKNTAYKLLKEEGFPCFKIGGAYRIPRKKFDQWARSKYGDDYQA